MISRLTLNTRMQSLQYKILTRIINCGKKLFDWHINDSIGCWYCTKIDDIQHYLIYCKDTSIFWHSFSNWWNLNTVNWHYPKFCINAMDYEELILFGYYSNDIGGNALNYCLLFAKMYIHNMKQMKKKLCFYEYLPMLKRCMELEKSNW